MGSYNFDSTTINTREGQRGLVGKSFFYMFLFLIYTFVVSIITHFIIRACGGLTSQNYSICLFTVSITLLVVTIVMAVTSLKSGKAILPCFLIYAACMGVWITCFEYWLNWWTILSAFGIASLAFGGMALIGYYAKNASVMGMIGFGLLFGVAFVAIFNVFMFIFMPLRVWTTMDAIVSCVIVIATLLISAFDVHNIKKVAETGENSNNMALFFAFNLYSDFILIVIHLLRIAVLTSRH